MTPNAVAAPVKEPRASWRLLAVKPSTRLFARYGFGRCYRLGRCHGVRGGFGDCLSRLGHRVSDCLSWPCHSAARRRDLVCDRPCETTVVSVHRPLDGCWLQHRPCLRICDDTNAARAIYCDLLNHGLPRSRHRHDLCATEGGNGHCPQFRHHSCFPFDRMDHRPLDGHDFLGRRHYTPPWCHPNPQPPPCSNPPVRSGRPAGARGRTSRPRRLGPSASASSPGHASSAKNSAYALRVPTCKLHITAQPPAVHTPRAAYTGSLSYGSSLCA